MNDDCLNEVPPKITGVWKHCSLYFRVELSESRTFFHKSPRKHALVSSQNQKKWKPGCLQRNIDVFLTFMAKLEERVKAEIPKSLKNTKKKKSNLQKLRGKENKQLLRTVSEQERTLDSQNSIRTTFCLPLIINFLK